MKKREHWKSRVGFIWAATGSAVGLGSIWRFPYVMGQNGGAAFVLLFFLFLFFISLPVLISEIIIGRKTELNPTGAFKTLGKGRFWQGAGGMTVITGFIVSSFYSVICGWTLGYLVEAIMGNLTHFTEASESAAYFSMLSASPSWSLGCHFAFMTLSAVILYVGVQKGIEAGNKVMMPLLFFILIVLVIKGLTLPDAWKGVSFVFSPDWSSIKPTTVVMALGQAFFGLSLGQGTMVTYGSYLNRKVNIPNTCIPIALSVTIVSLLSGIAIFTVVFAVGGEPTSGTNLMFQTLPMVFSRITGGYPLAILFFLLILLAAFTSQISAMEPSISYFMDSWGWKRHHAVIVTAVGAFFLGIPSALAFGVMKGVTFWGMNFFDAISFVTIDILIPLGGLAAVLLIGWRWGLKPAFEHLKEGAGSLFQKFSFVPAYLKFSVKFLAPVIIVFILLNALGIISV